MIYPKSDVCWTCQRPTSGYDTEKCCWILGVPTMEFTTPNLTTPPLTSITSASDAARKHGGAASVPHVGAPHHPNGWFPETSVNCTTSSPAVGTPLPTQTSPADGAGRTNATAFANVARSRCGAERASDWYSGSRNSELAWILGRNRIGCRNFEPAGIGSARVAGRCGRMKTGCQNWNGPPPFWSRRWRRSPGSWAAGTARAYRKSKTAIRRSQRTRLGRPTVRGHSLLLKREA